MSGGLHLAESNRYAECRMVPDAGTAGVRVACSEGDSSVGQRRTELVGNLLEQLWAGDTPGERPLVVSHEKKFRREGNRGQVGGRFGGSLG